MSKVATVFVTERGPIEEIKPPEESEIILLVAVALDAGFRFGHPKEPFGHFLEKTDEGVIRTHTWIFEGNKQIVRDGQKWRFADFQKCFLSADWRQKSPDHWISRAYRIAENMQALFLGPLTFPAAAIVRNGDNFAVLTEGMPEDVRKEYLTSLFE